MFFCVFLQTVVWGMYGMSSDVAAASTDLLKNKVDLFTVVMQDFGQ